ncbi:hypothetical protein A0U92_00190 [Acetobacter aceti]|uniref:Uncharacterized protein n=1 Tax=Acetobacter aceti TaxID=435 RepID=A0A1U9KC94_ACEAC|nr:hypothetical protein A0U92_00190 [Acetobacter aceti]
MTADVTSLLLAACTTSAHHLMEHEQKNLFHTMDISIYYGIRLRTVILIPKETFNSTHHLPTLLTRSIYGADDITSQMDDRSETCLFDAWGSLEKILFECVHSNT